MEHSLVVVCEVFYNARCVVLTVLDRSVANARLRLDERSCVAMLELLDRSSVVCGSWVAVLPSDVDWARPDAQLRREEDFLCIRLSLRPTGPFESTLELGSRARDKPTSIAALPSIQQANNVLQCRKCSAVWIDGSPFDSVLRLPSANWLELAELWGCHTETFVAAPQREIVIEPRRFYVGEWHMCVHASHMRRGSYVVDEATARLTCAKCGIICGRRTKNGEGVELFFDCVTDGRRLWSDWNAERRVARQLLQLSQGTGAMRFSCGGDLVLRLLNWDCNLSVQQRTPPSPVLKVVFEIEDDAMTHDASGPDAPVSVEWNQQEKQLVKDALARNARFTTVTIPGAKGTSFLWL